MKANRYFRFPTKQSLTLIVKSVATMSGPKYFIKKPSTSDETVTIETLDKMLMSLANEYDFSNDNDMSRPKKYQDLRAQKHLLQFLLVPKEKAYHACPACKGNFDLNEHFKFAHLNILLQKCPICSVSVYREFAVYDEVESWFDHFTIHPEEIQKRALADIKHEIHQIRKSGFSAFRSWPPTQYDKDGYKCDACKVTFKHLDEFNSHRFCFEKCATLKHTSTEYSLPDAACTSAATATGAASVSTVAVKGSFGRRLPITKRKRNITAATATTSSVSATKTNYVKISSDDDFEDVNATP